MPGKARHREPGAQAQAEQRADQARAAAHRQRQRDGTPERGSAPAIRSRRSHGSRRSHSSEAFMRPARIRRRGPRPHAIESARIRSTSPGAIGQALEAREASHRPSRRCCAVHDQHDRGRARPRGLSYAPQLRRAKALGNGFLLVRRSLVTWARPSGSFTPFSEKLPRTERNAPRRAWRRRSRRLRVNPHRSLAIASTNSAGRDPDVRRATRRAAPCCARHRSIAEHRLQPGRSSSTGSVAASTALNDGLAGRRVSSAHRFAAALAHRQGVPRDAQAGPAQSDRLCSSARRG